MRSLSSFKSFYLNISGSSSIGEGLSGDRQGRRKLRSPSWCWTLTADGRDESSSPMRWSMLLLPDTTWWGGAAIVPAWRGRGIC